MLELRPVHRDDCQLLFSWVNDLDVRAGSFDSAPISWDQHLKWFEDRLDDDAWFGFIVMDETTKPIGQVRFDITRGDAVISLSLAPIHRGNGRGVKVIQLGTAILFDKTDVKVIHAYIRPGNVPSIRAFRRAGFQFREPTTTKGEVSQHWELQRGQRA